MYINLVTFIHHQLQIYYNIYLKRMAWAFSAIHFPAIRYIFVIVSLLPQTNNHKRYRYYQG